MSRILLSIAVALSLSPMGAGGQAPTPDSATIAHDHSMADLTVTAIQSLRLMIGVSPALVSQKSLTDVLKLSPAALKEVSTFVRDSLGMRVTPSGPAGGQMNRYILFTSMQGSADSVVLVGRLYQTSGQAQSGGQGRGGGQGRNSGQAQDDGQSRTGGKTGGTSAFCIGAFLSRDVWYVWRSRTVAVTGEVIGTTPPPLPPNQDPCKEKNGGA